MKMIQMREMTANERLLQNWVDVLAAIEALPVDVQLEVLTNLQEYVNARKAKLSANYK